MTRAQRKIAIAHLHDAIEDCRVKADDPNECRWDWIDEAKALRAAIKALKGCEVKS